ncbi:MAG: TerC family protein, partial [Bacteroidia bacterium]
MHDWSADVSALFSLNGLIGLITLSFLEIILGIDNIIFISIAVNKLPVHQQKRARTIGLLLALLVRSVLLFFVGWIASLKDAFFHLGPYGVSG